MDKSVERPRAECPDNTDTPSSLTCANAKRSDRAPPKDRHPPVTNRADLRVPHAQSYAHIPSTLPDYELQQLLAARPADFWLSTQAMPWAVQNGVVWIACADPVAFSHYTPDLKGKWPKIKLFELHSEQITSRISELCRADLVEIATTRISREYSCRSWGTRFKVLFWGGPAVLLALTLVLPRMALISLVIGSTLSLLLFSGFRLCAFLALVFSNEYNGVCAENTKTRPHKAPDHGWPKVSVLVPLYKEPEIAHRLLLRLQRLSYPKHKLEVFLILEQDDKTTHDALGIQPLPSWIKTLVVPDIGQLKTKPRAMNYALPFCSGDIIGVWDAEDRPAEDQVERVVHTFTTASDDTVCVQGILDYYNAHENWRAACFALEYSSWFRVVLPGMAKLNMALPLGGTTLFVKRKALETLQGWDAHNVTEDADLGIRIYRFGWRTQMMWSVTYEEAACQPWAWIRQRSRWLKGFMVTYAVHMRHPLRLFRQFGVVKTLGFHAFFIGTLGQFLFAPLLWAVCLLSLTPVIETDLDTHFSALLILFIMVETLNFAIGWLAVSRPGRKHLRLFLPLMPLYYMYGAVSAYKALFELGKSPYLWQKTQHGKSSVQVKTPNHQRPALDGS